MAFVSAEKVREAARRFREEASAREIQSQTIRVRDWIANGMAEGHSAIKVREKLAPEITTALREAGYEVVFSGSIFETTITWGE